MSNVVFFSLGFLIAFAAVWLGRFTEKSNVKYAADTGTRYYIKKVAYKVTKDEDFFK